MEFPKPQGDYTTNKNISKCEKVALYARVSSEEQARNGEGIEDQIQALRRWATENGVIVWKEYIDSGFSARKSYKTRPALKELLQAIENGEVTLIVFTKLDRWFRSSADFFAVQQILDRYDCRWKTILENFTTEGSEGKFVTSLMMALAEREANIVSDRMKFTFAEKRMRGEYIGGTPPIGYMVVNKKFVINPNEHAGTAALFSTYLETGSQRKAIAAAAENGLVRSTQAFSRIFHRVTQTHAGKVYGVDAEPYLTMEQAEQIEKSCRHIGRSPRENFIFSGLVYCAECKRRMGGHGMFVHGDRSKRYRFYNCHNHYAYVPPRCESRVNISEAEIEQKLIESIDYELKSFTITATTENKAARKKSHESTRKRIKAKGERLLDAFLDGTIPKDVYVKKKKQIEAELSAIPEDDNIIAIPEPLPEGWIQIYNELNENNKRTFWNGIFKRIEITTQREIRIIF